MNSNLTERLLKILDWIFEILSLIGLGVTLYLVITTYPELPDRIPKHWNFKGIADQWGGKANFLTLPIIMFFIYAIFSVYMIRSNVFKLKASIGNNNARQVIRLSRIFKFVLTGIFLLVIYVQSMNFLGIEPLIENPSVLIKIVVIVILTFTGLILFFGFKNKQ